MPAGMVFAYHGIGELPRRLDPYNLMVTPARLREQAAALRARGYRFVSLGEFAGHLEEPRPPEGLAVMTFDDGTRDNIELLEPLLAELEIPATIFICPGMLGEQHFAMPAEAGVRLMDADEVRRLAASRWIDIGSHTSRHTDLASAGAEEAYQEMAGSKAALEELLQSPVTSFAYPKCDYSPACPEAARRAGYTVALSCAGRGAWRRYELERESIGSLDGRLLFALKSRRLFTPLRESPPGKVLRAVTRRVRHGDAA